MTVSIPESVPAEGNVKVLWAPVLADPAAPTVAELDAGTDISCYLMPDWEGPTAEQNKVAQRRFCSKQSFDVLGRTAWTISQLEYTYDPQGEANDEANLVYTALKEGNTGHLVIGYGIDPARDFAAGDTVDTFPVATGVQVGRTTGEDEGSPLTIRQELAVSGLRRAAVKVVA